jgi:hypothetical protein
MHIWLNMQEIKWGLRKIRYMQIYVIVAGSYADI